MSELGPKAIACLLMAFANHVLHDHAEWERLYAAACAEWSEKAVCAKFAELSKRGYTDYGVSARTGWLTPKGRAAVERYAMSVAKSGESP